MNAEELGSLWEVRDAAARFDKARRRADELQEVLVAAISNVPQSVKEKDLLAAVGGAVSRPVVRKWWGR
jgi:hypothetical protein